MSFSAEIKNELCRLEDLNEAGIFSRNYGLLLFSHFSRFNFSVTTENESVFELYKAVVTDYCGAAIKENEQNKKKLTAFVEDEDGIGRVFEKFGHDISERNTRVNLSNVVNDDDEGCIAAFLRGVFLACGSVTEPEKGYHLEFVVPYKKLSQDLVTVFSEIDMEPKTVMRKGNNIVYFRDSEKIEDFLALIGADNAALYLINVKIEKDVKNKVNRRLNFELSNMDKSVQIALGQVESIKTIQSTVGLSSLPEQLEELAKIRLENPEASFKEINEMLSVPLSKSGLSHRFARLNEIAREAKASKSPKKAAGELNTAKGGAGAGEEPNTAKRTGKGITEAKTDRLTENSAQEAENG